MLSIHIQSKRKGKIVMKVIPIEVSKVIESTFAISMKKGEILYQEISKYINEKDTSIKLDFSHIKGFASPFLNVWIGPLLKNNSKEFLLQKIEFLGLDDQTKDLIDMVINNAENYFKNPEVERRKAMEYILAEYY